MRQLTCTGPGKIVWQEVPEPRLQSEADALVRPLAVARCEIDPHLISGNATPAKGPFALGHECVGEVVEVGSDVQRFAIGQKVVIPFQVSCGSCRSCSRGYTANCDQYPVLSDYGMQPLSGVEYGGFLSDLVRVPHADAMLQPISDKLDPVALASVSDNVLDGYRTVAPHLVTLPGAEVLFVAHGTPSIALYGAQTAIALGASKVLFASDDREALALAEKIGCGVLETNFAKRSGRFPIVVDCGTSMKGFSYALASTEPEGIFQSVSWLAKSDYPMALGRLYTLGIKFFIGRAHAVALLPEVIALIEAGRLRTGEITTRVVSWEDAPEAYLEPALKLVVQRSGSRPS